jgi:catalase
MADSDLSAKLVDSINASYGSHLGHRAAHAKGVLCAGRFVPHAEAATLSRAAHFHAREVRVHARFSNGSGNPASADHARDGRGMAIKLYLPDGTTTDIVTLSLPAFFARTPDDLLAFNEARRADPNTGQPDMARVGAYLAEHPEAVPAVTAAITHPIPASYATLTYHALHAFGFDNGREVRFGRYHVVPEAGEASLSDEEASNQHDDYLCRELETRFAGGPIGFDVVVQLAAPGDPIDDPTAPWADTNPTLPAGRIELTARAYDRETDGDILVFDPTRVTDGIQLTDDPILHARRGAYAESVARRTRRE